MRRRSVILATAPVAGMFSLALLSGGTAMAAGGAVSAAAHTPSPRATWGSRSGVRFPAALRETEAAVNSVSCASPGNCGAGGSYQNAAGATEAFIVSEVNGIWGGAAEVAAAQNGGGDATITSVSCKSPGNCSAGGYYAGSGGSQPFVVNEANGVWGSVVKVGANLGGLGGMITSLSCASPGNCAATGNYTDAAGSSLGLVVSETNGAWGSAETVAANLVTGSNNAFINSVSCGSPGSCSAGGSYGTAPFRSEAFVVSEVNGNWGSAEEVGANLRSNGQVAINSVSCAAAGDCSGVGEYTAASGGQAFAVSEANGAWGGAKTIGANLGGVLINSLSCATPGNCAAGGSYSSSTATQAVVISETDGAWGSAQEVAADLNTAGAANINSVSCITPGDCTAGGYYYGNGQTPLVVSENNGDWGSQNLPPDLIVTFNGAVNSVSCTSPGNCTVGGSYVDNTGVSQAFDLASSAISVVQLGDSIAAGEGIGYGYAYDPATGTWSSALPNQTWSGPYPECHDTPEAYGGLVADALGAAFTSLGCTGASYDNGITQPETTKPNGGGTVRLPVAELADPAFTAADPSVVLITFGADDVYFSDIVQSCLLNPEYPISKQPGPPLPSQSLDDCTKSHPGPVFKEDFPKLSQLASHYAAVVSAIDAAAPAGQAPPKIVFTNYMDPFPDTYVNNCPDLGFLDSAQLSFLNGALESLDGDIQAAVTNLNNPNVTLADVSNALAGHTWCTSDPWDYGLSILKWKTAIGDLPLYLPTSQAPFHPTAAGQDAIARDVLPYVDSALGITGNQPAVHSADGDPGLANGVTVAAGATVTGTASGFTSGGTVTATLDASTTTLQTLTAAGDGSVSFSFTVPNGTASGQHQLILTDATTGAAATLPILVSPAAAKPSFTAESPPVTATAGAEYYYSFTVNASPGATLSLGGGAPSWLYIDDAGDVYGIPPAGTTSFTYTVTAANPAGTASTSQFKVTIP